MGGQRRDKRLFELDKMMQQGFGETSVGSRFGSYWRWYSWCSDAPSFLQERKAIEAMIRERMQYSRDLIGDEGLGHFQRVGAFSFRYSV